MAANSYGSGQPPPNSAALRADMVAKLKRTASLPRMKNGRRPPMPMHAEGVSEGERVILRSNDPDVERRRAAHAAGHELDTEAVGESDIVSEPASLPRMKNGQRPPMPMHVEGVSEGERVILRSNDPDVEGRRAAHAAGYELDTETEGESDIVSGAEPRVQPAPRKRTRLRARSRALERKRIAQQLKQMEEEAQMSSSTEGPIPSMPLPRPNAPDANPASRRTQAQSESFAIAATARNAVRTPPPLALFLQQPQAHSCNDPDVRRRGATHAAGYELDTETEGESDIASEPEPRQSAPRKRTRSRTRPRTLERKRIAQQLKQIEEEAQMSSSTEDPIPPIPLPGPEAFDPYSPLAISSITPHVNRNTASRVRSPTQSESFAIAAPAHTVPSLDLLRQHFQARSLNPFGPPNFQLPLPSSTPVATTDAPRDRYTARQVMMKRIVGRVGKDRSDDEDQTSSEKDTVLINGRATPFGGSSVAPGTVGTLPKTPGGGMRSNTAGGMRSPAPGGIGGTQTPGGGTSSVPGASTQGKGGRRRPRRKSRQVPVADDREDSQLDESDSNDDAAVISEPQRQRSPREQEKALQNRAGGTPYWRAHLPPLIEDVDDIPTSATSADSSVESPERQPAGVVDKYPFTKGYAHDIGPEIDLGSLGPHPFAKGAFGDVRLAFLRDGRQVAIKCLRFYTSVQDAGRHKLEKKSLKEIRVWSYLKHDNVLPLLGLCVVNNELGMVSEFMPNGNVQQYIRCNPSVDRFWLAMNVCAGLAYLHEHPKHVIHGDLKAVNVVVDANGIPKLMDFGLAQMIQAAESTDPSSTSSVKGTLRWMARELIDDEAVSCRPTAASDVWSLGMTIYEIFSETFPFANLRNEAQVMLAIMREKLPERVPNVFTEGLWEFLLRCWRQKSHERPTAREALVTLGGLHRTRGHIGESKHT